MSAMHAPAALFIPDHPSLSHAMRADVARLVSLPLRHWRRWNHRIGDDPLRGGNCHHAATALIMDLIEASAATGWRIGSGFTRMPAIDEPVLHSWIESPAGAVVDASQTYRTGSGLAVSREHWFRAHGAEPLIQRRPGQVAWAVRRFGLATAALLPLSQLLDAAAASLL
jgi:hypothetical protein